MTRVLLRDVVEGARDRMGEFGESFRGGKLTESEIITRYLNMHRGNPAAILEFARLNAPEDDPIRAAAEYQTEMERKLKALGG